MGLQSCDLFNPPATWAIAIRLEAITPRLEAIALRLEAIASRLESITIRLLAMASRLEVIALRLEAIISRLEATLGFGLYRVVYCFSTLVFQHLLALVEAAAPPSSSLDRPPQRRAMQTSRCQDGAVARSALLDNVSHGLIAVEPTNRETSDHALHTK